jgi:kanamycin kinase/aminoglycoside 3'-phosphotransferase-3
MYIPKIIQELTHHEKPKKDRMGMSGSYVYMYKDYVLKIRDLSDKDLNKEYQTLIWLQGKLPVPKPIYYIEKKKYGYFLMTRLHGVMTCDKSVKRKPYDMISLLAKGLNMMWNVPIQHCPFDSSLKEKLRVCGQNIKNNYHISISDAEDNTYGEKGFKDPKDLYQWLVANQPDEELVFSHSDYCLPNVLVEKNEITGFLDFDRAGIACKWADIALCVRSIYHNFGHHEDYIKHLFQELNIEPNWDKIRYYILLDELY